MLWARASRERNVTGVVDWDTLHGNAAHQQAQWTSEEARVGLAKVTLRAVSRHRGKEVAKAGITGKAKAGRDSRGKVAQASSKVDGGKEAVRDIKGRVGHVVRWVTRRAKANVEAKVVLIGQFRKFRKSTERQCKVWK